MSMGAHHGAAMLKDDDVIAIRNSGLSGAKAAKRFGISKSHACRILARKEWTHV